MHEYVVTVSLAVWSRNRREVEELASVSEGAVESLLPEYQVTLIDPVQGDVKEVF